MFQNFARGWREKHPDWSYVLWSSPNLNLQNHLLIEKASECVPERNIRQFQADVMRYEILEQFGGVYVDTDFECLKPIGELLDGVDAFAAWEKQDVWIGNAVMGCVPHHPFLREVIQRLPFSVERNKGQRPNISTGPQFITKLYREDPMGLTVLPEAQWYPVHWSDPHRRGEEFPDAVAAHWWSNKSGIGRDPRAREIHRDRVR